MLPFAYLVCSLLLRGTGISGISSGFNLLATAWGTIIFNYFFDSLQQQLKVIQDIASNAAHRIGFTLLAIASDIIIFNYFFDCVHKQRHDMQLIRQEPCSSSMHERNRRTSIVIVFPVECNSSDG